LVCPVPVFGLKRLFFDAWYVGKKDLVGVANYWQMVMDLRPYLFRVCSFFFCFVLLDQA